MNDEYSVYFPTYHILLDVTCKCKADDTVSSIQ